MQRPAVVVPAAGTLGAFMLIALVLAPPSASAGSEGTPRTLGWEDLVPPPAEFDDPFAALTEEQLYDLSSVAAMRQLKADGSPVMSEERTARLAMLEQALTDSGIDIDDLLSQRERVKKARQAQAESVVGDLDGQTVRIPGYVLPLEFDGRKVREFLLVPYVGACIHTPPPPANQIVHVKPATSFESRGLFQAVWVTGDLSIQASKQSLFLVDGASDISIGYGLKASSVEAYSN